VDSSPADHSITFNGEAQLSSVHSKFGASSVYFPGGPGAYLQIADSADWNLLADYTIDFWVRLPSATANETFYNQDDGSGNYVTLMWDQIDDSKLKWFHSGGTSLSGAVSMTADIWHHVAVTREDNTAYLFFDGTLIDSGPDTTGVPDIAAPVIITASANAGWLDEFRIVKGRAAWTANFTPGDYTFTDGNNVTISATADDQAPALISGLSVTEC